MLKPNTDTLYQWAHRKLGPSKCKRIKLVNNSSGNMGLWDWEGTIRLNLRLIHSRTTLYRVLAHEWTHAQQLHRDYLKGDKQGYWLNPLEKAARHRERTLWETKPKNPV